MSLKKYLEYKIKVFKKILEEAEMWYIITTIIKFILKLNEKDLYHSDIKPDNVILQNSDQGLKLKFIDWGSLSEKLNFVPEHSTE